MPVICPGDIAVELMLLRSVMRLFRLWMSRGAALEGLRGYFGENVRKMSLHFGMGLEEKAHWAGIYLAYRIFGETGRGF